MGVYGCLRKRMHSCKTPTHCSVLLGLHAYTAALSNVYVYVYMTFSLNTASCKRVFFVFECFRIWAVSKKKICLRVNDPQTDQNIKESERVKKKQKT